MIAINTQKLYEVQPLLFEFESRVLLCRPAGERYEIILERTAFFPEGGGQPGDSGYIGGVRVLDTQIRSGEIVHIADEPVEQMSAHCSVDRERRMRFMQNHTGEHILSGLAHSMYGCANVGFHMGSKDVTVDFDIELSAAQLEALEKAANDAVVRSLAVTSRYPEKEELARLDYRSKLDLEDDVRIVEVEGIDLCACCAPHVPVTSMVGLIRIIGFSRWKGGVRLHILCGLDAVDHYAALCRQTEHISCALSCEQLLCEQSVQQLLAENERLRRVITDNGRAYAGRLAQSYPAVQGNICCRENTLDDDSVREFANLLCEKCTGVCAVLRGNDDDGYSYIIRSDNVPLRSFSRDINTVLNGRGGGDDRMLRGKAKCTFECACAFFEEVEFYV